MGMRPNKQTGNPGRSYRFYTGEPVFRFGEGLSYTTFQHFLHGPATIDARAIEAAGRTTASVRGASSLSLSSLSKATVLTITCNTTNTGKIDGAEVIMVFSSPPAAGVDGRPLQSLVAFERVFLQASSYSVESPSSVTTRLDITAQHLTVATAEGIRAVRRVVKGEWKFWVGVHGKGDAITVTVL